MLKLLAPNFKLFVSSAAFGSVNALLKKKEYSYLHEILQIIYKIANILSYFVSILCLFCIY